MKYSIVIPTRNRAKYLRSCLDTVPLAGRDDVEIVVADNSDPEESTAVEEVIREKRCPLIRHERTPQAPLCMSANWEFAVSAARGDYILVIGDDDGLLPSTLAVLDQIIARTGARVVRWPFAGYNWPDFISGSQRNHLRVPLTLPRERYALRVRDGHKKLREVLKQRTSHEELPMLYNAAIHRGVIEKLAGKTGNWLPSVAPDVYSGMAVAYLERWFVDLGIPLGVCGLGGKSNGAFNVLRMSRSDLSGEFLKLSAASGRKNSQSIPCIPCVALCEILANAETRRKFDDLV